MQTSFLEHHFCKSNDKTVVMYGGFKVNINWRVQHVLYTYIATSVQQQSRMCLQVIARILQVRDERATHSKEQPQLLNGFL